MMQLAVADLDVWWVHIESLDLQAQLGVQAPRAPEMQPWGLRVSLVLDLCGALWQVVQS